MDELLIDFGENIETPNLNASNDTGIKRNPQLKPIVEGNKVTLPIGAIIEANVIHNANEDSSGFFEGIKRARLQIIIEGKKDHKDQIPARHYIIIEPVNKNIQSEGKNISDSIIRNNNNIIQEIYLIACEGKIDEIEQAYELSRKELMKVIQEKGWFVKDESSNKLVPNITEERDNNKTIALYWHESFKQAFIQYAKIISDKMFKENENKISEKGNELKRKWCYWHLFVNNKNEWQLAFPPFCEPVREGVKPSLEHNPKLNYTQNNIRKQTVMSQNDGISNNSLPPIEDISIDV